LTKDGYLKAKDSEKEYLATRKILLKEIG